uniref:Uncharacterized protein n=1 Tax=Trypanosoma congolense (strain IL3000) TaxID=1068625 RepID=G0V0C5_TRYCI|nr:hypothetical protein, unlikely [Trypanosoma congolense IL3000]
MMLSKIREKKEVQRRGKESGTSNSRHPNPKEEEQAKLHSKRQKKWRYIISENSSAVHCVVCSSRFDEMKRPTDTSRYGTKIRRVRDQHLGRKTMYSFFRVIQHVVKNIDTKKLKSRTQKTMEKSTLPQQNSFKK